MWSFFIVSNEWWNQSWSFYAFFWFFIIFLSFHSCASRSLHCSQQFKVWSTKLDTSIAYLVLLAPDAITDDQSETPVLYYRSHCFSKSMKIFIFKKMMKLKERNTQKLDTAQRWTKCNVMWIQCDNKGKQKKASKMQKKRRENKVDKSGVAWIKEVKTTTDELWMEWRMKEKKNGCIDTHTLIEK